MTLFPTCFVRGGFDLVRSVGVLPTRGGRVRFIRLPLVLSPWAVPALPGIRVVVAGFPNSRVPWVHRNVLVARLAIPECLPLVRAVRPLCSQHVELRQPNKNEQPCRDTRLSPDEDVADIFACLGESIGLPQAGQRERAARCRVRRRDAVSGDAGVDRLVVLYSPCNQESDSGGDDGESENEIDANVGAVECRHLARNSDEPENLPDNSDEAERGNQVFGPSWNDALESNDARRCEGADAHGQAYEGCLENDKVGTDIDEWQVAAAELHSAAAC